ncbi:MAG: transketolase [Acidimicrobiales bacterium]|nr:transketolase [Acidimicrobiales bacterium]
MALATRIIQSSDDAEVAELAQQLRVDSIRATTGVGSGHPTSSLSAADLMAVLLARHFRYSWDDPSEPANDRLVLSKGHASPLLYAMFKAAGAVSDEELISTYRRAGSRLQGHPTPAIPWVDVATGSLGQGLPYAVGMALAGAYLDRLPYQVFALCGDSELAEGSMWEALDKAAYYGLSNLTAIVDVNRLGQRGPTEWGWDLERYQRRVESFGCQALVIDGHDVAAIDRALAEARDDGQPSVVLARTVKGKGVSKLEDAEGWHGLALPEDTSSEAVAELGGARSLGVRVAPPVPGEPALKPEPDVVVSVPTYAMGDKIATRKAYGEALTALGARPEVVALDGEVSNSTYAEEFKAAHPERYFEMFIAEQQMAAAAVGLSVRGYVAFASTFAAFWSRAYDFVRMAGISGASIRLCGSHAGVEIGADGPSQMGLEDLAAMRAVQGSVVLYPADAAATAKLVAMMADTEGVVYLRTTRGAYPVIYSIHEAFPIGGSKVLRTNVEDQVALVGAGVTVYECLEAAHQLADHGIHARVVDLYSVKPVDGVTLREAVADTGGRLVVVEDHHPEGGLGSAVMEELARERCRIEHLAVSDLPGSGTTAELLDRAGISARHIVEVAEHLVQGS